MLGKERNWRREELVYEGPVRLNFSPLKLMLLVCRREVVPNLCDVGSRSGSQPICDVGSRTSEPNWWILKMHRWCTCDSNLHCDYDRLWTCSLPVNHPWHLSNTLFACMHVQKMKKAIISSIGILGLCTSIL